MKEEQYALRHWFLRYASSGLTIILLSLLGIRNDHKVLFIGIGSVMGMWFFFRYFSVATMNKLVNKVYVGEIMYGDLFSYQLSKQRFMKVIIFTLLSTGFWIVLNYILIFYYERMALFFLIIQSFGVILLSYQRASKKMELAKTAEAIEKARFFTVIS